MQLRDAISSSVPGIIAMIALAVSFAVDYLIHPSPDPTRRLDETKFSGIVDLEKPHTNIVIVHGIGDHCIGYADTLIQGLASQLAVESTRPIEEVFLENFPKWLGKDTSSDTTESNGFKIQGLYPLLDGNCKVREEFSDGIQEIGNELRPELRFDRTAETNIDTTTLAQNQLCRVIRESGSSGAYCNLIRAKSADPDPEADLSDYITGFIRTVMYSREDGRTVRFVELTWSPSTRWIKGSLHNLERLNNSNSTHWINRLVKSDIINSRFADAVAYLSQNGVLVQYDVLLTLCSVLADPEILHLYELFTCDQGALSRIDEFSRENDVVFISHSLGTRILLDTLGMLSLGAETNEEVIATENDCIEFPNENLEEDLLSTIKDNFENIGAVLPSQYLCKTYREALNKAIGQFAESTALIFAFTNQVPLLSVDLSSPLRRSTDGAAIGFTDFLDLRIARNPSTPPLQVVSFHDPDDVLSYDLACWYNQEILRRRVGRDEYSRNVIRALAVQRVEQSVSGEEILTIARYSQFWHGLVGIETRTLYKILFRDHCLGDDLKDDDIQILFEDLQDRHVSNVKLVGVTVRLTARRYGFVGDPTHLHSNYLTDEVIHGFVANGHHANGS